MRKKLKVDELKLGMQFESPIYFDKTNILIPANTAIKLPDLDRLKRWKISEVEIETDLSNVESSKEDKTIQNENKSDTKDFVNYTNTSVNEYADNTAHKVENVDNMYVNNIKKRERQNIDNQELDNLSPMERKKKLLAEKVKSYSAELTKVFEGQALNVQSYDPQDSVNKDAKKTDSKNLTLLSNYFDLLNKMKNILFDFKLDKLVIKNDVYDLVDHITNLNIHHKDAILNLIYNFSEVRHNYLVLHSVNVALYTVAIGLKFGLSQHKLNQLCIAALLHDVGMTKVPENILSKKESLSEQEYILVKNHTLLGYKLLNQKQGFPNDISMVALQHHERYNGTGYPTGLQTDSIAFYARIVAVADSYDAMTQVHAYKLKHLSHNAIKNVLAASKNLYDPEVSRVFLSIMSIYPIGSLVQLNNGLIGLVSRANPNLPLRPIIRIIIDEFGDKVMNTIEKDLEKEKNLFITKILDPQEEKIKIEDFV